MASREVELIKERLNILEVIGGYVELHKAGRHYKGKSPFTNEKTPSFFVSPERGMYYCFSSQKGGDIFTFIEEMEGVDFRGALKLLAEKAGVELIPEDPKKRDARELQYAMLEEAAKFFFAERERNKAVTEYVINRGVKGATMHAWRIGYAPDAWRALRTHLTSKKFTDAQMLAAGLIKKAPGGKEPYDVFRDRVMFPIADTSGRIVAFSGRTLKKDEDVPKYVNSPETELFVKSEILYGYDKAKQGIRQFDFSLIVEGQFDVVLSHQAGYTNAVAVSGTALTEQHLMLLQRLSSRVVLALDADRAGIAAVKRSSLLMLSRGMDVKVAKMVGGKDPADIVKENPQSFKKIIGRSVHVIEYLLEIVERNAKDERSFKLHAREEILPLILAIPNKIDREHFEEVVSRATKTTKEAIHYELERLTDATRETVHDKRASHQEPKSSSSRRKALIAHLHALACALKGEYDLLSKEIMKHLHDLLPEPEFAALEEISDTELSRTIITAERYLESIPEKQLSLEISGALTDLSHLLAREELAGMRKKLEELQSLGEEGDIEAHLRETKRAELRLQQTIEVQF